MKSIFSMLGLILVLVSRLYSQSVAINNDGTLPQASAILDVKSTSKGMLVPRMTSAQRAGIVSPAPGLLVYDTDNANFWFYNGVGWTQLTAGGSSPWLANGNNIINTNSGRVGIGTTTPNARLALDSGLVVDQSNSNTGSLNSAIVFGNDNRVGISRSFSAGSVTRSGLALHTGGIRRFLIDSTGQVGIGTTNPIQTLHVEGNSYLSGALGLGIATPIERLHVNGSALITGVLNPSTPLSIGNNTAIGGSLTVNNNKGVAYNPSSSINLKIAPFTTANFHAILGPFGSAETAIALPAGFTSVPSVFVGSINGTGGTAGELNRVILVLWGCTTNACNAKIINTDNVSVDYNITWRCLAVGN